MEPWLDFTQKQMCMLPLHGLAATTQYYSKCTLQTYTVSMGLHYMSYQSHFGLYYLLLCDAAVAVVQSEGLLLFLWKVFSVVAVTWVATAFALSTGLGTVWLAYIVVVLTGVRMPFSKMLFFFIAKAARSL